MADRDNAPSHEITQCNKKLVTLLDKIIEIDLKDTAHLAYRIDDCKSLARELSYERKFLHSSRRG